MKKHLVIVIIITAALSAVLAFLSLNINFIPYPSSVERESIDNFVKILFAIASIFFALIVVVFTYSLLFFRARPGDSGDGRPIKRNSGLEVAWTTIPLAIVLILAAFGGIVLNNITRAGPPGSELEIEVTAARFSWEFNYPAYNISTYELHVPVNQRVHFSMQSKDVIHSFWVQEWGPKMDIVPGMTTEIRYTPTTTGKFLVQCSQLCGYGHTYMIAPVVVSSPSDFQAWIQQQQKATPTPSSMGSPTPSPSATTGAFTNIDLTAQNMAFDKKTITVPASVQITINFNNMDSGTPHNFAVYTDSSAGTAVFKGEIITGPTTTTYKFTSPTKPGNYFFRCDVHPTTMTGTLVVQ